MSNWLSILKQADLDLVVQENLIQILQICRQKKDLAQAERLHVYLQHRELDTHPVLANHLIPTLVDCGCVPEAQHAFDKLPRPHRSVYAWTSLISAYVDTQETWLALDLYDEMQSGLHCIQPNSYTYLAVLTACAQVKDSNRGHLIHNRIIQTGLDLHLVGDSAIVSNALLNFYAKCGMLIEAENELKRLCLRDVVSWNALIAGYAEQGLQKEIRSCLHEMQIEGLSPDHFTFVHIIKCCGIKDALTMGREMHIEAVKRGLDNSLGNTIMDMYSRCGSLSEAYEIFNWLDHDIVTWNTLITGYAVCRLYMDFDNCFHQMQLEGVSPDYVTFICSLKLSGSIVKADTCQRLYAEVIKKGLETVISVGNSLVDLYVKCGLISDAQKVFERLACKDTISWNVFIGGHSEHGHDEEVLSCYKEMLIDRVSADIVTFLLSLKACRTMGALETGQEMHAWVMKLGLEKELCLGNIIIGMYGRCDLLADGQKVFTSLPTVHVDSWNTMIKAYGEKHKGHMALQCFQDMVEQGALPDSTTFTCLLAACSHLGLVLQGQDYFVMMREKYDIEPTFNHLACMVDLFIRSGYILEAGKFISGIGFVPSSEILLVFLNGCKIHEEVELAQTCFHYLIELNKDFSVSYLLMADIYASVARWNDAKKIEEIRNCIGVRKIPGSASIEVEGTIYKFSVGMKQNINISATIGILSVRLKMDGHIPIWKNFLCTVKEAIPC